MTSVPIKLLSVFSVLLTLTCKIDAKTPESIEEALKCMFFVKNYNKDGEHQSSGTGFIVDDGATQWVLTNAHVIEGATRIEFIDSDGKKLEKFGRFQCFSKESGGGKQGNSRFGGDGVRLELKKQRELAFAESKNPGQFSIGSEVITIGDNSGDLTMDVLNGKVTALSNTVIQSTCKIVGGSSGGILLDPASFEVIGLNTFGVPGNLKLTDAIWQIGVNEAVAGATILHTVKWIDMDIGKFLKGSEVAMKFRDTVRMLAFIYFLVPQEDGYKFDSDNQLAANMTFEQAFLRFEDDPLLGPVIGLNRKLSAHSGNIGINKMDLVKIYARSLSGIRASYREQRDKLTVGLAPYYLIDFEESGFYKIGDNCHEGLGDAEAWFAGKSRVGGSMPVGRWFNMRPLGELAE